MIRLELDPKNPNLWLKKGALHREMAAQYDLALLTLNRGIELDPEHSGLWLERGAVFQDLGEFMPQPLSDKEGQSYGEAIDIVTDALGESSDDPLLQARDRVFDGITSYIDAALKSLA